MTPAINQWSCTLIFRRLNNEPGTRCTAIVTQAWSPLGRANQLVQDPTIRAVADRLGKTIPQVIVRWHVQLGAISLPKATSEAHQIQNLSSTSSSRRGIWTRSRR